MARLWTAIPNFVDCSVFRSIADREERRSLRSAFGIPEASFVVGCVAAVKKNHKRVDYLIREVERWIEDCGRLKVGGGQSTVGKAQWTVDGGPDFAKATPGDRRGDEGCGAWDGGQSTVNSPPSTPFLLIAGARTDETSELIAMTEQLLPGQHRILLDCARQQMPDVYRAMDVFVLPSLFEMMPIALLEAMASGLPCLVNRHPVLEWMIGKDEGETRNAERREKTRPLRPAEDWSTPASTEEGGPVAAGADRGMSAGGVAIDMASPGALARTLAGLSPEWMAAGGAAARRRAVAVFSREAVIGQYVDYYRRVLNRSEEARHGRRLFCSRAR